MKNNNEMIFSTRNISLVIHLNQFYTSMMVIYLFSNGFIFNKQCFDRCITSYFIFQPVFLMFESIIHHFHWSLFSSLCSFMFLIGDFMMNSVLTM
eukprot:TRINITY_DN20730_c0_g1_i1.p1 TRINITY_DN20730_c0_g1~~TRINITY_DN20730_c0_g1_i1.p1  ORF type:complete len:109 (+),score=17.69 TRINITY_DN20730_c0_g1_i1:45-329(+)